MGVLCSYGFGYMCGIYPLYEHYEWVKYFSATDEPHLNGLKIWLQNPLSSFKVNLFELYINSRVYWTLALI